MDYEAAVNFIRDAETTDEVARAATVSLTDLGNQIDIDEYDEKETKKVIDFVDGAVPEPGTPGAARQTTADSEARQDVQAPSGVGAGYINKPADDAKAVAAELGKAVAMVQKSVARVMEKPTAKEELVMVNLSLSDQINELEKISYGLEMHAFNDDQLKIIKLEMDGLKKKKITPTDNYQIGLLDLRDRRLAEVIRKLGM